MLSLGHMNSSPIAYILHPSNAISNSVSILQIGSESTIRHQSPRFVN